MNLSEVHSLSPAFPDVGGGGGGGGRGGGGVGSGGGGGKYNKIGFI